MRSRQGNFRRDHDKKGFILHSHGNAFYTHSHQDSSFIHQHIVDAQIAQAADGDTKSISIIFALTGLYLYLKRRFTGRQVQEFHMKMAKNKRQWPTVALPKDRRDISVPDMLAASAGQERDKMIRAWCEAVWDAYKENENEIVKLVSDYE